MIFRSLKNKPYNRFYPETPGMHFYCCNDAVPWLNEAKSWCTVIFINFQIHLYFVCHLPPACRKTGSTTCTGPIFLTKNVIGVYNTNLLFRKRFIHCALVIPFILHWPSLFFSKVSNSWKKVLITPGLYFHNYCITYLPHDISRDFNKWEHVILRREWTRAVFEELYYAANNQKIADQKKADYQEGLEKSRADSAAQSRDSYMKGPEKSHARSRESYMKDPEKSRTDSAARTRPG